MVTPHFLLLTLALIPLGMWSRRFVGDVAWPGQIAVSFAFGLWSVVLQMFVLSLLGVHWNAWMLVPLPLVLSAISFRGAIGGREPVRPAPILILPASALALLVSACLAAMATSGDYVYFWGVKGQRWGATRILDWAFTTEPAHYMHPDYPPLLPLYYAWTMLGGDGTFDWWGGVLGAPMFLLAGGAAMWAIGRRAHVAHIDGIVGLFVSLFALFYVRNQVGGNAEPALHMFEAIALTALIARRDGVAAIALSGVALTKVEGGVFVLLVCGLTWLGRDGTLRERLRAGVKMAAVPVATLASWLTFSVTHGLTANYVPKDDLSVRYIWPTFLELIHELSLHLWYVPWILFGAILLCGRVRAAWPYLAAAVLFVLFLLSIYTRPEPHLEWSAGRTLMTPVLLVIAGTMAAHREVGKHGPTDSP